jgi:hypothetical protein
MASVTRTRKLLIVKTNAKVFTKFWTRKLFFATENARMSISHAMNNVVEIWSIVMEFVKVNMIFTTVMENALN